MAHTKDLHVNDAILKLREIVSHDATCMFHTCAVETDNTRPMMVQQVDDAGSIWFLSGRSSDQNKHIALDPRVRLTSPTTDTPSISVRL